MKALKVTIILALLLCYQHIVSAEIGDWWVFKQMRNIQHTPKEDIPGMTKQEVWDHFGTPEKEDIKYDVGAMYERYEYKHSIHHRYGQTIETRMILIFRNGVVVDVSYKR